MIVGKFFPRRGEGFVTLAIKNGYIVLLAKTMLPLLRETTELKLVVVYGQPSLLVEVSEPCCAWRRLLYLANLQVTSYCITTCLKEFVEILLRKSLCRVKAG
jgi:hypothetical protein